MANTMIDKGYEYAMNFTGEAVVKKLMEVYKSPIVS